MAYMIQNFSMLWEGIFLRSKGVLYENMLQVSWGQKAYEKE